MTKKKKETKVKNAKKNLKVQKGKKQKQFSIATKAMICACICTIVAITTIILVSFPKIKQEVATITQGRLVDQAGHISTMMTAKVDYYNNILNLITTNSEVAAAITGDASEAVQNDANEAGDEDTQDPESINMLIKKISGQYKYIKGIALVDKEGTFLYGFGREYEKTPEVDSVLNIDVIQAQSDVLDVATGSECIATVVPIKDKGSVVGAAVCYIGSEAFDEVCEGSAMNGIGNLTSYVMDRTGIIFGHTEDGKVGTLVQNAAIRGVLDRIAAGEEVENGQTSYEYKGLLKYAGYQVMKDNGWIVVQSVDSKETLHNFNNVLISAYTLSVVCIVLAAVVMFILLRIVLKPIRVTEKVLKKVGSLNLVVDPAYAKYEKNNDETGAMSRSINAMIGSLREEVNNIQAAATKLDGNVVALDEIATTVAEDVNQNVILSQTVSAGIEETSATTETIVTDIEQVQNRAKEMAEKVKEGLEMSERLQVSSSKLKERSQQAQDNSKKVFEEVKEEMEQAREKAKSVEKIGKFTSDVMSIADQTQLLSLNASIEAARAGEAGKGFAVVAEEINSLAQQCSDTVNSITALVEEIYVAVNSLEGSLNKSLSFMEEQVMTDYQEFCDMSQENGRDSIELQEKMKFIDEGVGSFVETMSQTVESIEQISVTIQESAQDITDMAMQNSEILKLAEDTSTMVEDTKKLTESLKSVVQKFEL